MGVCRARQLDVELCVHPDLHDDMNLLFVIIIHFECEFSWLLIIEKKDGNYKRYQLLRIPYHVKILFSKIDSLEGIGQ